MASNWGMTPQQSILFECERRSRGEVIRDCVAILEGHVVDDHILRVIGGPAAEAVLEGRRGGLRGYWPHVWAARGLLHVWDDVATDAINEATTHTSWRVREMSAKVIARHHVSPAVDAIVMLLDDENARVRTAASRAFRVRLNCLTSRNPPSAAHCADCVRPSATPSWCAVALAWCSPPRAWC